MMVPSDSEYDPGTHLSPGGVAVVDGTGPSLVRMNIKQSKTDLF